LNRHPNQGCSQKALAPLATVLGRYRGAWRGPLVYDVYRSRGYEPPLICTPQELITELPNE
ncbi:MAG TPA: hypothetical protein VNN08_02960, partial [Thermoanaerobaculia bacterium]|nr:hypothetical protein [Thermoanaerobaculia bacterium]